MSLHWKSKLLNFRCFPTTVELEPIEGVENKNRNPNHPTVYPQIHRIKPSNRLGKPVFDWRNDRKFEREGDAWKTTAGPDAVWSLEGEGNDKITGGRSGRVLELRVRIVGHALLLQMPRTLRLEWAAYVSNQLGNLSGRLSAPRARAYRPRYFLFRNFDSRLAERVADYRG